MCQWINCLFLATRFFISQISGNSLTRFHFWSWDWTFTLLSISGANKFFGPRFEKSRRALKVTSACVSSYQLKIILKFTTLVFAVWLWNINMQFIFLFAHIKTGECAGGPAFHSLIFCQNNLIWRPYTSTLRASSSVRPRLRMCFRYVVVMGRL